MASSELFAEMSGLTDTTKVPAATRLVDLDISPPAAVAADSLPSPSPSVSSSLSDHQRAVLEPADDDHESDQLEEVSEEDIEEAGVETKAADQESDTAPGTLSFHTFFPSDIPVGGISFKVRCVGKRKFIEISHDQTGEMEAEFVRRKLEFTLGELTDQVEDMEISRQAELDRLSLVACGMGAVAMLVIVIFVSMLVSGLARMSSGSLPATH
jgi:hypothetical protein